MSIIYSREHDVLLAQIVLNGKMKVKEIIKIIQEDGWALVTTKGSHRHYKHPLKLGRVTIPGKLSSDLNPKTLNSVLKQAGLKTGGER